MEPSKEKTQEAITATYVRFKVTTCLCLSPNNRARSLSTLMADNVNKDTKIQNPVITTAANVKRQIFHCSFTIDIKRVT